MSIIRPKHNYFNGPHAIRIKGTITKGVVCCFFLQLIAANIISIDVSTCDMVKWCLSCKARWFDKTSGDLTEASTDMHSSTPPMQNSPNNRHGSKVHRFVNRYEYESSWCGVHLLPSRHKKKYEVEFD